MKQVRSKPTIHFWVLYPLNTAPSQRFRMELFEPVLRENNIPYRLLHFFDARTWEVLYEKGNYWRKFFGVLNGFLKRIAHLFISNKADYVFILREATPTGPPVFEWLLSKVFRKKIIYDFDDAIWLPGGEKISWFKKWMKATWKIKYIIRWAYKVSAGNDFLSEYAKQFNSSVIVLPTGVDTERGHNLMREHKSNGRIVVGWTGSHTTLHNLDEIKDLIPELKKEIEFDFLIISNKKPDWNFDFIFKPWNAKTEIEDLLQMHIGLMPLKKGPWFEGKCGFKLIQYLACGIPAVASPVGVNSKIIIHNENGFIANDKTEWAMYIKLLINDAGLRTQMGAAGRRQIEENYSLNGLTHPFLSLFS